MANLKKVTAPISHYEERSDWQSLSLPGVIARNEQSERRGNPVHFQAVIARSERSERRGNPVLN
jgi:hypothetical protein